jgi:hypothetical protein
LFLFLIERMRLSLSPHPQLSVIEAGQVTTYRAGELAKLHPDQQEIAVAQWVSRSRLRTQGQAIEAAVIRGALRSSKVDLGEIASAIRDAIALARL